MRKFYLYSFCLLLFLAGNQFLSAQCGAFYDGFESPTLNPAWTTQGTGHSVSFPTAGAQVGNQQLALDGFSTHYGGIYATFPAANPTYISYHVKPTLANAHDGYFIVGDGNLASGSNSFMVWAYFQSGSGNFRLLGNGANIQVPYTVNTWYFVEYRNINWTNKTFEVWVNGVSAGSLTFYDPSITNFQRVHLYNYNSTSIAYYDEIIIGGQNITSSFTAVNAACNGDSTGMATLTASGAGSLSYAWSTGDTGTTVSNLASGWYNVDITDSAGCTVTDSVEITEPTELITSLTSIDPVCPGGLDGSADLTASGGTVPYAYAWTTGDTTEDLMGIGAGLYVVTTTDSNGCMNSDSAWILDPAAMVSNLAVTDISCNGEVDGAIDLSVTGGTAPYMYMWASGDTTEDIAALGPGTYSVAVTDSNGCALQDSAMVNEPAVLSHSASVTDETGGAMNGAIDLTVSGGTPAYSYVWSGPGIFLATTEDITGLAAGEYIVQVTDTNGCTVTDTFMVSDLVSLDPFAELDAISVYPNPFREGFTLNLGGLRAEELQITLMDLSGRVLIAEHATQVASGFTRAYALKDLSQGMYMLEVKLDGQRKVFRVVRE